MQPPVQAQGVAWGGAVRKLGLAQRWLVSPVVGCRWVDGRDPGALVPAQHRVQQVVWM